MAENSGQDASVVLAALRAAHANGDVNLGIDITAAGTGPEGTIDIVGENQSFSSL